MKINTKYSVCLGLSLLLASFSLSSFAQTVNLNNRITSALPAGTVAQWHTSATPSAATLVSNASAVALPSTPTNYWAFYYDNLNNCYSPGAKVTLAKLSCPSASYNLTSLPGANASNVVWHTSATPTSANKVNTPTQAVAGTYYAFFYDAVNNCYSPAGTPVIVDGTCSSVTYTVDGYVYNDLDGLADNSIYTNGGFTNNSGTNTFANGLGGMYAILYNSSNIVVASVAVNAFGYYNIPNVPVGSYAVTINAYPGTVGNPIPAHTITPGWQSTGERIGIGSGTDASVDGHSAFFNVATSNVFNVNFGIRLTPTPAEDCYTNNPYMPVNAGNSVTVNGITITPTARSGSVAEGYQGVFGCTAAAITTTSYALWGGYNSANLSDHGAANANTAWSITYTFSQPINNLRILLGSMGALGDENLIVNVDGIPATIVAEESCYTTISGNQITGGATAPYPNGAGGGVFVLSKTTAFNTLTFSGAGGWNGLNIEFCSSSIIAAPMGYSLSGTVFNDANGFTDGYVNGDPIGTTVSTTGIPAQLFANLINASNVVVATVQISANGTYNFTNVPVGNYWVQLTTNQGTINAQAPATALMPGWNVTGEALGSVGSDGYPDQVLAVNIVNVSVTDANFGIQRPPNSDNKSQTVLPVGSAVPAGSITTNVTGLDAEDGTLGNVNTIVIKSLPTNSIMNYAGNPVVAGQVITGFNPTLLSFTGISNGSISTGFTYSFRDAAGHDDPTPATYIVNWTTPLSVTLLSFDAVLKGSIVALKWVTTTENNNKGFFVERSFNSKDWMAVGFETSKAPNGNSSIELSYSFMDEYAKEGSTYYRLKQVDHDGATDYSKVVRVNINKSKTTATTIHPNPANDYVIVANLKGNETIRIIDMTGKVVRELKAIDKTFNISLNGLGSGLYSCIINTANGTEVHKLSIKK